MKKILIISIALMSYLFTGCKKSKKNDSSKNQESTVSEETKVIKNINTADFKELITKDNVITLDVRTKDEVAQANIEGSSNIDFYDKKFIDKINLIDKTKIIAVYCKSGGRSSKAANLLKENGFKNIYNLDGGMIAWENAKLPVSKATLSSDEDIKAMSLIDFKKLLTSDKTILINFYTEWCLPCRKMAPIVDEIEKEFKDKAIVMRIDLDKSEEIAKEYNITGVPVFMVYKNGKNVWKYNGVIDKEILISKLE